MTLSDIIYLRCVDCKKTLKVLERDLEETVVINALLQCMSCGRHFPIIDKVGIFFKKDFALDYLLPNEIKKIQECHYDVVLKELPPSTSGNPEPQFNGFNTYDHYWEQVQVFEEEDFLKNDYTSRELFKRFIPINFEDFQEKTIFIACGGGGRDTYHVLQYNPKKVFIVEITSALYRYNKLFPKNMDKLVLLRGDLRFLPIQNNVADISICDHALQHVQNHKIGFKSLAETTKPKGSIGICVYSYENNLLMTHLIEPLKGLLIKIPRSILRLLSLFPAIGIWLIIHLIYMPLNKILPDLSKNLFLNEHMIFWSKLSLKSIWAACYDLMTAPVSYHFKKSELEEIAFSHSLQIIKLVNTHSTTWSMICER
jgi:uncharacterized protein YbaR (Trm112 family)